jgi:hypothetical protein
MWHEMHEVRGIIFTEALYIPEKYCFVNFIGVSDCTKERNGNGL